MKPRKLSTQLRALGACPEAVEWANPYATLQEAWDVCPRGDWMLWLCARVKLQHAGLPLIAFALTEVALKGVAEALRSGAAVHPDKAHAEMLEHHAKLLEACVVDSNDAAGAASDAAWAARNAAWAASFAAGAARNAAWAASFAAGAARNAAGAARDAATADLVRTHISDVACILEAMSEPKIGGSE